MLFIKCILCSLKDNPFIRNIENSFLLLYLFIFNRTCYPCNVLTFLAPTHYQHKVLHKLSLILFINATFVLYLCTLFLSCLFIFLTLSVLFENNFILCNSFNISCFCHCLNFCTFLISSLCRPLRCLFLSASSFSLIASSACMVFISSSLRGTNNNDYFVSILTNYIKKK